MSYNVEIIESPSNIIEISSSVGDNAAIVEILQDNISNLEVSHDIALLPSDFQDNTKIIISNTLIGLSGVVIEPLSSGSIKISTSGLQPSGNYSVVGHSHLSTDITDFNTGVSGLIPVKSISAGSGIGITNNSGNFIVGVTGSFGLTSEEVDDRVANLLVSGPYVSLSYSDSNNSLTIGVSGVQPSGDYSLVGHSHSINNINNLQSALDSKAPILNPIFSGTVSGISKSMVGLGNVDNTSDLDKPVSSATQNALDSKASLIHSHTTSQITDFNAGVSGLLPVVNISAGSGIGVASTSGNFIVSVTGTFGLQAEQVDDRVSNLLKAGQYININYDDNNDSLTLSVSGLQPSGNYATLVDGLVPSAQLPSYVDDVLEYASSGVFPASGESSKIYVALDNNKTYRWGGTNYVEISASPGSTDSVPEGVLNKYYTDERARLAAPVQSVAGKSGVVELSKSDVGLGNVDNTSDANKPISLATQLALDNKAQLSHTHNVSDINNFNSAVSGLLPVTNISSGNYISVTSSGTTFNVSATGLQPSGNYSVVGHSHTSSDITNFNSSVSGLLPITDITGSSGISIGKSGTIYNISSTGLAYLSGANFTSLSVNNTAVSTSGHSHVYTDITNFASGVQDNLTTTLLPGNYISIVYDSTLDTLTVGASGLSPVGHSHTTSDITNFSSGVLSAVSGTYAPLGSPGFSGIPTVPTATSGTNNTQAASTAFVRTEIVNFSGVVNNSLNLKANLSGASFTGTVTAPTGDFVVLRQSGIAVSTVGHTHTSSNISDFNTSVSGLLPVTNISSGQYISVSASGTTFNISATGLQPSGNYSVVGHTHNSSNITDFNSSVSGLLPITSVSGGSNVVVSQSGTNFIVSTTGLQPSGNYANATHHHSSADITNFNSSVSGLLPVTNIVAGSNISVVPSGSVYTVSVSGQLGLTTEEVDDRISTLLVAGTGIDLAYNDLTNTLVITSVGSSPSGNYSLVGHTHTTSSITDFNTSVSGLLPVTNIVGGTNINISTSGSVYTVNVSGSLGLTTEEVDDRVSNLLVAGSGVSLAYNDSANTLTVSSIPNIVKSDTVSNVNYIGVAPYGSLTSSSSWTIRRTTYNNAGSISGTAVASGAIWDNRLSIVYT